MHTSFKQGLDKFDSKNYPNLEPEEIDLLLNQSQDAFVKQRYGYNNTKKQSFEQTQKRTEDLKTLVKSASIVPAANSANNINSNSVFATLPEDHWLTVQELTNITYSDCNNASVTKDVYTEVLQHDDYSKVINNPFSKPLDDKVLRLVTSDGVELLHSSSSSVNSYKIRYIKKPVNVDLTNSINSELPEITHQEVVNLAISIALENIESPRVKSFIQVTENREE